MSQWESQQVEELLRGDPRKPLIEGGPTSLPGVVEKKRIGPYILYEVSDPVSLGILDLGYSQLDETVWCTRIIAPRGIEVAQYYIDLGGGKVNLIYKQVANRAKPYLQFQPDFLEVRDVLNRKPTYFPPEVVELMRPHIQCTSPRVLVEFCVVVRQPWPEAEPKIATDVYQSYRYAKKVLKDRFPLGEPVIAKDTEWSYKYARDVLNDRFPLGEPAIAIDQRIQCKYLDFLKEKGIEIPEVFRGETE